MGSFLLEDIFNNPKPRPGTDEAFMCSAEELYRQFVSEAPELAERVAQKDLAGYLGVTAVGLNRIIKRLRCRAADSRI